MVTKLLRGNQPNGFPSTFTRSNFVGGVGTEDEGVVTPISQVIGNSGVLINVVTVQMGKYMVNDWLVRQAPMAVPSMKRVRPEVGVGQKRRGGRNELTLDRW